MRAMILVLPFLIALPELGIAEALPDKRIRAVQNTAELSDADVGLGPFADLPDAQTKNLPTADEFLDSDPHRAVNA